jgi:hypothetical protein
VFTFTRAKCRSAELLALGLLTCLCAVASSLTLTSAVNPTREQVAAPITIGRIGLGGSTLPGPLLTVQFSFDVVLDPTDHMGPLFTNGTTSTPVNSQNPIHVSFIKFDDENDVTAGQFGNGAFAINSCGNFNITSIGLFSTVPCSLSSLVTNDSGTVTETAGKALSDILNSHDLVDVGFQGPGPEGPFFDEFPTAAFDSATITFNPTTTTPEPGTLALLGGSLVLLSAFGRGRINHRNR